MYYNSLGALQYHRGYLQLASTHGWLGECGLACSFPPIPTKEISSKVYVINDTYSQERPSCLLPRDPST